MILSFWYTCHSFFFKWKYLHISKPSSLINKDIPRGSLPFHLHSLPFSFSYVFICKFHFNQKNPWDPPSHFQEGLLGDPDGSCRNPTSPPKAKNWNRKWLPQLLFVWLHRDMERWTHFLFKMPWKMCSHKTSVFIGLSWLLYFSVSSTSFFVHSPYCLAALPPCRHESLCRAGNPPSQWIAAPAIYMKRMQAIYSVQSVQKAGTDCLPCLSLAWGKPSNDCDLLINAWNKSICVKVNKTDF